MKKSLLQFLLVSLCGMAALPASAQTIQIAPEERCAGDIPGLSMRECLAKKIGPSNAELKALEAEVRKMMASWRSTPHTWVTRSKFKDSSTTFLAYREKHCNFMAAMRQGVGTADETEIDRLECILDRNSERIRLLRELVDLPTQ